MRWCRFAGGAASKVRVQCPEMADNDKLFGQLLEVEVATLQVRLCCSSGSRLGW